MATEALPIHVDTIPNQVVPTIYKGKSISKEGSLQLLNAGSVPGLVYDKNQAPVNESNMNGWSHVVPRSIPKKKGKKYAFRFMTKSFDRKTTSRKERKKNPGNDIYVQEMKSDFVCSSIRDGVDYYLKNHTNSITEGEEGILVHAGLKVDSEIGCLTQHESTKSSATEDVTQANNIKEQCFNDFHQKIESASPTFLRIFQKMMKVLEVKKSRLKLPSMGFSYVLPTYKCSESLTSSIMVDNDDAYRSYGLFFRKDPESEKGVSYMLFPDIGAAVKISDKPVLISWEGSKHKHCFLNIEDGIQSIIGYASKEVHQKMLVTELFRHLPKRKRDVCIGDTVYVRRKLDCITSDDRIAPKRLKANTYCSRLATVKGFEDIGKSDKSVVVKYDGDGWIESGDEITFTRENIIPTREVKEQLYGPP